MPKRLPWVVPEYCEGCTSCVGACPKGILDMRESAEDTPIPWLDDSSECTGCGRCEESCPFGGIAMTAHVEEATQRFADRCPLRKERAGVR